MHPPVHRRQRPHVPAVDDAAAVSKRIRDRAVYFIGSKDRPNEGRLLRRFGGVAKRMARQPGRPGALYQVSAGYDHRGIPGFRGARDPGRHLFLRYRSQCRPDADRQVHQDGDRQALPLHEHAVGGAAPARALRDRRDREARWRPVDILR